MQQSQPQYELTIQLVQGTHGGQLLHATDLPEEAARLLGIDLIALIHDIHHQTGSYPITGDHLLLGSKIGDLRYDGAKYSQRVLGEGEMEEWVITKRTFSNHMPGRWMIFEVRLARLNFLGPPDEALDLESLLRVLPTSHAQRAFQRWATNPQRPVKTWQQLAERCGELSSERGFNVQHYGLIEHSLRKHGYSMMGRG